MPKTSEFDRISWMNNVFISKCSFNCRVVASPGNNSQCIFITSIETHMQPSQLPLYWYEKCCAHCHTITTANEKAAMIVESITDRNWIYVSHFVRQQSNQGVKIKRNTLVKIMKRSLNNISFIKMIYHMICVEMSITGTSSLHQLDWIYRQHEHCWECQRNQTAKDKTLTHSAIKQNVKKNEKSIIIIQRTHTPHIKEEMASGRVQVIGICYSVLFPHSVHFERRIAVVQFAERIFEHSSHTQ